MKSNVTRQTAYARNLKAELTQQIGGKCALCSSTTSLQFDHIHGRDYDAKALSYSARLARYKREAAAGLLRLLCETCNLAVRKTNDAGQFVPTASVIEKTANIPF